MCWPSNYIVPPFSLSQTSQNKRGRKEGQLTQEEEDIDVIRSWVEVGGHPARQEGEAKELLSEVSHIPIFLSFLFLFFFFFFDLFATNPLTIVNIFDCYTLFPPSLQGLRLLHGASLKREEARKLETEAERMEAEGWGKFREAVMGSEAEDLYGLLRGVTSSSRHLSSLSLPPRSRISPGPSASPQPPPESTEPKAMDPVGPATVPAPVAAVPATEGDIPADMQPLRIQLGGTKRVYQCRVEGCKEGPSTSRAAICSHIRRVHLGVGLVCPLCHKSFFNPDAFRRHKKKH